MFCMIHVIEVVLAKLTGQSNTG